MTTPDRERARFEAEVARPTRRERGAFWTPESVAERLLDAADYSGSSVRIVDPACGGGALLFACARRMLARGLPAAQIRELLAGVDIDPRAIAAAEDTLGALLGRPPELRCADVLLAEQPAVAPGELVIANPPWVRFAELPRALRQSTLPLWHHYGLFSLRGHAARLGGGDKDLSLLFTLLAADRYLRPGGRLAMLITLEALKAKGAGQGFRRFRLPSGEPLSPACAHDLTGLGAFPGAAGKPAILVLDRGRAPAWPIPYIVHARRGPPRVTTARPAGGVDGAPFQVGEARALRRAEDGPPRYQARIGARVEPYGVYWLRVLERDGSGERLLVENVPELGKRPIAKVRVEMESQFLRPALRGRDVRTGFVRPTLWALLVQDPARRAPVPEAELRARAPLTYQYLFGFRDVLLTRGSAVVRELAQKTAFYAQYGVGPYTMVPHQVVWNRMGNRLRAAPNETPVLATDTCGLIACRDRAEATFLSHVLNSQAVARALACASDPGRGFASPGAIDMLAIPRYDPEQALHLAVAAGDAEAAERLFFGRG